MDRRARACGASTGGKGPIVTQADAGFKAVWETSNGHRSRQIEDVVAANVQTKPVEWLWLGRIPKGRLTMFDGDPGVGKSVVTMDIAARVSAGRTSQMALRARSATSLSSTSRTPSTIPSCHA